MKTKREGKNLGHEGMGWGWRIGSMTGPERQYPNESMSKKSHLNQQNTIYVGESTRAEGTANLLVCTYSLNASDFLQTYSKEEGKPQSMLGTVG